MSGGDPPALGGRRGQRVYVSGPMTGYPDYNGNAFAAAATALAPYYTVVNPAEDLDPDRAWADALRADLQQLLTCDGVATLSGWYGSRGARLEVHVAEALGMPVAPVAMWIAVAAGPYE